MGIQPTLSLSGLGRSSVTTLAAAASRTLRIPSVLNHGSGPLTTV
jgi:hypothetical protein